MENMKKVVVTTFPIEAPINEAGELIKKLIKDVGQNNENALLVHQTLLTLTAVAEMMGVNVDNVEERRKIQRYMLRKIAEARESEQRGAVVQ